MNINIPIFPLQLVIYPGSRYPLHIFEKRYKKMIRNCIDDKTGFVIVSVINDKISDVGCYSVVEEVTKTYDNGEFDIVVLGKKRVKIISMDLHHDGYRTAEIKDYRDTRNKIDQILLKELRLKLERILDEMDFMPEEEFWLNFESSSTKSFKAAEKAGLSLNKQQEMLNLRNENNRMILLIDHLDDLYIKLKRENLLKDFILRDGYINF
jgi:Lon protease-like protein